MNTDSLRATATVWLSVLMLVLSSQASGGFGELVGDILGEGAGALGDFQCSVGLCISGTSTNAPLVTNPPEPDLPCNGQVIHPDSAGNYNFRVSGEGSSSYHIIFSKNGSDWNDPINKGLAKELQVDGTSVPVGAGSLLLVSSNWYWRTVAVSSDKVIPSKTTCKFTIEPSGGKTALNAPAIVSPACGSQISGGVVLFDAKPGTTGKFEIFKAELQRKTAAGWTTSGLLSEIDKTNPGSKYGVAIPFSQLDQQGTEWRWRVRLYNEKMPLFGNSSVAPWTDWCAFNLPAHPATKPAAPQDSPVSGATKSQAGVQQAATSGESAGPAGAAPRSGMASQPDVPAQTQRTPGAPDTTRSVRTSPESTPQPAPNRSTVRSAPAAMLLNVEGEELVNNGRILVAGGQVMAQPMAGFGAGWSGDAQLFWSGGAVGAVLDLLVDIPVTATYAMELYPSRAPDYGQVSLQVDGKDVPVTMDNYAPRVMAPAPRQIGKFSLEAGVHKISFMIVGKQPQSSGYLFGIDRIRLYPSGP